MCNKAFITAEILCVHKGDKGERLFRCEICNKAFAQAVHIRTNKIIHTDQRPFNCEICDKAFSTAGNLCKHKISHTGERLFRCEICDKAFAQAAGYTFVHIRTFITVNVHLVVISVKSIYYSNKPS